MPDNEIKILFPDGEIISAHSNLKKEVTGELVFNTAMTGYQEILTDPSYKGQIVVMTYPLIGNYGVKADFDESDEIMVSALIIKENPELNEEFYDYLYKNNILCVYDTDTRKLTKKIREKGAINCLITPDEINEEKRKELENYVFPIDTVKLVSKPHPHIEGKGKKLALIDFGVKKSIVQNLKRLGADITFFPYDVKSEEILKGNYDGVLFSNGPGDPKDAKEGIQCAKELINKLPLYGICLGHQILALALNALTYKLKFGHRGANHPVINTLTNKVTITSQNHGYAVKAESFPENCKISHLNLNDNTVEGFICEELNIKTVQFHPEAGPGPKDAETIFDEWFN